MNVGELKHMLGKYPEDMEVIHSRMSDYESIEEGDWSVINAVSKDWGTMRSHPTMSAENKQNEKRYLHLKGN